MQKLLTCVSKHVSEEIVYFERKLDQTINIIHSQWEVSGACVCLYANINFKTTVTLIRCSAIFGCLSYFVLLSPVFQILFHICFCNRMFYRQLCCYYFFVPFLLLLLTYTFCAFHTLFYWLLITFFNSPLSIYSKFGQFCHHSRQ